MLHGLQQVGEAPHQAAPRSAGDTGAVRWYTWDQIKQQANKVDHFMHYCLYNPCVPGFLSCYDFSTCTHASTFPASQDPNHLFPQYQIYNPQDYSGFLVAALDHEMVSPDFTPRCAQALPPDPQTNIETDLPFSSTTSITSRS